MSMVITIKADLATALSEEARRSSVTPDELANRVLRERLLPRQEPIVPRDEWERQLLAAATNCGVSLPDDALTSEALYD